MKKDLFYYATETGKRPLTEWLSKLKDVVAKSKIQARLDRLALGDYGDCKHIRYGIYELRINYGPGYRVYYREIKSEFIVLLLNGGSKKKQKKDIDMAIKYWNEFKGGYSYD